MSRCDEVERKRRHAKSPLYTYAYCNLFCSDFFSAEKRTDDECKSYVDESKKLCTEFDLSLEFCTRRSRPTRIRIPRKLKGDNVLVSENIGDTYTTRDCGWIYTYTICRRTNSDIFWPEILTCIFWAALSEDDCVFFSLYILCILWFYSGFLNRHIAHMPGCIRVFILWTVVVKIMSANDWR